jgi:hypothetical protein
MEVAVDVGDGLYGLSEGCSEVGRAYGPAWGPIDMPGPPGLGESDVAITPWLLGDICWLMLVVLFSAARYFW